MTDRKNARSATDIDVLIGRRLRAARQLKAMSQDELGAQVGVTFQQIQKYERGANRISGSRLWALAQTLDLPITYFFPSEEDRCFDEMLAVIDLPRQLGADTATAVLGALGKASPKVQRDMVNVIKALAEAKS